MKKTLSVLLMISGLTPAFAGPLGQKMKRLEDKVYGLKFDVDEYERGIMPRQNKMEILSSLNRIQQITNRMKADLGVVQPGPRPPVPPRPTPIPVPPPTPRFYYSAVCHIDNDSSLTYGENIIGTFEGQTIKQILDQCALIADQTYGTFSSYGIKNLKAFGYEFSEKQSAICHIDNDSSITFGENVVGTVVAKDAETLMGQCDLIAQRTYGTFGSAGLKRLNENRRMGFTYQMSATCHIDNDSNLTYNENIVGTVWGNSLQELTGTCKRIATQTYGTFGSGGIRDIRYNRNGY